MKLKYILKKKDECKNRCESAGFCLFFFRKKERKMQKKLSNIIRKAAFFMIPITSAICYAGISDDVYASSVKSRLVRPEQPANIPLMYVTFCVSSGVKSKLVRLEQPANM